MSVSTGKNRNYLNNTFEVGDYVCIRHNSGLLKAEYSKKRNCSQPCFAYYYEDNHGTTQRVEYHQTLARAFGYPLKVVELVQKENCSIPFYNLCLDYGEDGYTKQLKILEIPENLLELDEFQPVFGRNKQFPKITPEIFY